MVNHSPFTINHSPLSKMAFEVKKYTNIFEDMRNSIPPALDDFALGIGGGG